MKTQRKLTYKEVKFKYEELRQIALEVALEDLPQVLSNKHGTTIIKDSISLEGFTFRTNKELKKWESLGSRLVDWEWDKIQRKYRAHPKRFEITVWYKQSLLCGAGIGKPTWSGGKMCLDYIEASPASTPLDGLVTDIAITTGVLYARSIGANQFRIMNPITPKVREHYLSKAGFSYNESQNFCFRDLQ